MVAGDQHYALEHINRSVCWRTTYHDM